MTSYENTPTKLSERSYTEGTTEQTVKNPLKNPKNPFLVLPSQRPIIRTTPQQPPLHPSALPTPQAETERRLSLRTLRPRPLQLRNRRRRFQRREEGHFARNRRR